MSHGADLVAVRVRVADKPWRTVIQRVLTYYSDLSI